VLNRYAFLLRFLNSCRHPVGVCKETCLPDSVIGLRRFCYHSGKVIVRCSEIQSKNCFTLGVGL
jgi:hypothetical protein